MISLQLECESLGKALRPTFRLSFLYKSCSLQCSNSELCLPTAISSLQKVKD